MANTDNIISMIAGGTITEYAVVSLDGNGKVVVTTAATDQNVIGVAQRAANAGDAHSNGAGGRWHRDGRRVRLRRIEERAVRFEAQVLDPLRGLQRQRPAAASHEPL